MQNFYSKKCEFLTLNNAKNLIFQNLKFHKASEWFKKCAKRGNGNGVAWYARSIKVNDKTDAELVYLWGKKALSSDYPLGIGYCHFHGMGTPTEREVALSYFAVSAEEGDEFGEYMLGDCYYFGEGTEQEREKAFYWSLKAAEKGLCIAQLDVAYMYREGHGCEENNELSMAWNEKSSMQSFVRLEGFGFLFDE